MFLSNALWKRSQAKVGRPSTSGRNDDPSSVYTSEICGHHTRRPSAMIKAISDMNRVLPTSVGLDKLTWIWIHLVPLALIQADIGYFE